MQTRAELLHFPIVTDSCGSLIYAETGAQLPFTAVRFFVIAGVPTEAVRGRHAHRACQQLAVAVHGSCRMRLTDGAGRDEVTLDSPTIGLYIPPLVWVEQSDFEPETVVLVLASMMYDPADYIRSFPEFLDIVAA